MVAPSNTTALTPAAHLPALLNLLTSSSPPSHIADTLDQLRRLLPSLPANYDARLLAESVANVLREHPSNLLLAHRAVAILAHPALCGRYPGVETAVVGAMDRLMMSAAFQHTAMAALQNAAGGGERDRDVVVLAVVSAMRQHHAQNGVLLRGADLVAFHLNQTSGSPLTSSYRVASRIVVDTIDKLSATPQGASTALLALVATARHISSLAAFGGRPSSTTRFSRGSTASGIVDHVFAYAVVLAMARHRSYAPVQVLGCEVIRVGAAGATSVARLAAKELYAAGAASAIVAALQAHPTDASVVDKGVVALRSLLLGGGFHGRSVKPSLHLDIDLAEFVARVAERVSDSIAVKDRDLGSAAAVLAMDVRAAVSPGGGRRERGGESRLSELGKRIMRRIRFGQKLNFYEAEYDRFGEENYEGEVRPAKDFSQARGRRGSGRSSFSVMQTATRRGLSNQDMKDVPATSIVDVTKANRKMSDGAVLADREGDQITLNRKWRSVSGRWNQRGRRGSHVSTNVDLNAAAAATATGNPRRERRGPLTLSGSEMANLSRQPSRIFGKVGDEAAPLSRRRDPRNVDGRHAFVTAGGDDYGF